MVPHSFELVLSRRLGVRFTQQTNFISDLEEILPQFYREFGSDIRAWVKPPPKIMSVTRDMSGLCTR